jgi:hypothetical protein
LANEIRAGLEKGVNLSVVSPSKPKSKLDEISFGKPVRQHVREFGAIFATICVAVCAVKLYKGQPFENCALWGALGAIFAGLGYLAPAVLHPIWQAWMKLAHYLSLVMTFLILAVAWCIGFVPMAGIMKAFRIKTIDLSYKADVQSYWVARDPKYDDFQRLNQQY